MGILHSVFSLSKYPVPDLQSEDRDLIPVFLFSLTSAFFFTVPKKAPVMICTLFTGLSSKEGTYRSRASRICILLNIHHFNIIRIGQVNDRGIFQIKLQNISNSYFYAPPDNILYIQNCMV